jgi:conjugal transfer/entry exclusion protein
MLNGEVANHKKSLEQHDMLKRAHDTYKEEADRRTKELGEAAKVQMQMSDAKRKLEGDLAKVQKAIGDLKYFEIVGGPTPTK